MFCKWCGKYAFFRGGPIAQHGCPDCEGSFFGGHTTVSRDDDPTRDARSSSDDDDSSSDYRASTDDVPYPSEDSYSPDNSYSPSSSTSSSSDDGGGIVLVILLVVGLMIAALLSRKHSDPQNAPVDTVIPPTSNQSQPATAPQSPPVYLFQNTLPGTYNMGQDQRSAQPNRLEAENQGLTSSSEQSSVPTALPADPPTVRCILSTGVETLISGTECHERSGTIYTEIVNQSVEIS